MQFKELTNKMIRIQFNLTNRIQIPKDNKIKVEESKVLVFMLINE